MEQFLLEEIELKLTNNNINTTRRIRNFRKWIIIKNNKSIYEKLSRITNKSIYYNDLFASLELPEVEKILKETKCQEIITKEKITQINNQIKILKKNN